MKYIKISQSIKLANNNNIVPNWPVDLSSKKWTHKICVNNNHNHVGHISSGFHSNVRSENVSVAKTHRTRETPVCHLDQSATNLFFFYYLLCVVHVYIFGVFIICPSIDSPVFRVCYFILNQIRLQDARHSTSTENWFYCFLSVFGSEAIVSSSHTYLFVVECVCAPANVHECAADASPLTWFINNFVDNNQTENLCRVTVQTNEDMIEIWPSRKHTYKIEIGNNIQIYMCVNSVTMSQCQLWKLM